MFCATVSEGRRLKAWKTKPMRARRRRVSAPLGELGQLDLAERDRPRGRPVEPGGDVEERALARTRGPHDRGERPGRQLDADAVERDDGAVAAAVDLADLAEGDGGGGDGGVGLGGGGHGDNLPAAAARDHPAGPPIRRHRAGDNPLSRGASSRHTGPVPRRVLIVDDHPSFREAARDLLEDDGYEVVGEAGDGAGALACVQALAPEVVLLDVGLPDIDGIEVARRLAASGSSAAVVLVSSRDGSEYSGLIDGSGARGFLGKSELSVESLEGLLA